MPADITNYKCPACTGPLHFVGASGRLECDYCGSSYEVAEVEALMAEAEAKAIAADEANKAKPKDTDGWGEDAKGMKVYGCPSCGAELICDENTAATCCPYCGNQTVVPGQFHGALKPDYVIPFKTDKEQAINALKDHYKGKRLLPDSFIDGNHIEDIQGVYVPFWLFDCETEGEMSFDAEDITTKHQGEYTIKEIKKYRVEREGKIKFEKVPADASSRMPDTHMDSIEPFDYSELKGFSTAYMPGFLADRYDVESDECKSRMEERCISTTAEEIRASVSGYSTVSEKTRNIKVKDGKVSYAMLPVWMLSTKWNDQNFLFAMNGQTGKMVGDLPVDSGKFWKYFAKIFLGAMVAMFLFAFLAYGTIESGTAVMCLLIPAIIAFIVCQVFKGQMKSVFTPGARNYESGNGLALSHKEDLYLRTEVQKTKNTK